MASAVDVCNFACTLLGADRITALTDDTKEAREMNAVYEMTRLAELRKFRWAFAIKRASLPALSDVPDWGFALAYQLPPDYVSLIQVGEFQYVPSLDNYVNGDNAMWSVESGQLLTDLGAPLKVRYVWNVSDPGTFDPLFSRAFAGQLAYNTCERITGSNTKRETAAADYKQAVKDALRINAIERAPSSIQDDSWLSGRL